MEEEELQDNPAENGDSLNAEEIETPEENNEEEQDSPTLEDFEELRAKAEKLEKTNQQLYKRLKKLPQKPLINQSDLSRDEIVLLAKGVPEDEIDLLKTLQAGSKAQGKEVTLSELQKHPAITALREKKEKENRSLKGSLGASGKSIQTDEPKFKEGMTSEEHKKAWEEVMNSL